MEGSAFIRHKRAIGISRIKDPVHFRSHACLSRMWLMRLSKDRNLPFYFNTETCRSQWKCPADFIPPQEVAISRKRIIYTKDQDQCIIYQVQTNRGRCFYWNKRTGQKTWSAPAIAEHEEQPQEEKNVVHRPKTLPKDESLLLFADFVRNDPSVMSSKFTPWDTVKNTCIQFCSKANLPLSEWEMRGIFNECCAECED